MIISESASLTLDKKDSLESKLLRASSEKISCLQKTVKKKEKLKKINTRNINKKLNRKKVLNNHLKSENKEL